MGLVNFMKTSYVQKLEEEDLKQIKLKKKGKNNFFSSRPTFVAAQRLFLILMSQINVLHKLYSHVHYAMTYHHKKLAIK